MNGRLYFEKPPLHFWLMAASFEALGYNEFAGRLPSALAGLALVFLVGWFGRREAGETAGLLGTLFFVTSLLVVMLARTALVDMLLTLWTTASLIFFYLGYRSPEGTDRRYFYAGWAALGLAFLTKGPVGAAVPLLALVPLALLNRDLIPTLKRVRILQGILIFLIISGPWYVLAFIREGRLFWDGFFVGQNVRRYTEVLLGHGPPIWYFLPVMAAGLWPWFFFAWPTIWRGLVKTNRAQRLADRQASLDHFLAVWFLTGLLFFSLGATKLPHYIMPVAPAAALLAGRWWAGRLARTSGGRLEAAVLYGLTGLIGLVLAVSLLAVGWVEPWAMEKVRAGINPDSAEYAFPLYQSGLALPAALVGLLVGVVTGFALLSKRFRKPPAVLAGLALAAGLLVVGLTHLVAPAAFDYLQTPAKELARQAGGSLRPRDRLAAYGLYKPTMWFYTGRHIERIRAPEKDKLKEYLDSQERVFLLSRLSLVPVLEAQDRFRLLAVKGGYLFGDNQRRGP